MVEPSWLVGTKIICYTQGFVKVSPKLFCLKTIFSILLEQLISIKRNFFLLISHSSKSVKTVNIECKMSHGEGRGVGKEPNKCHVQENGPFLSRNKLI